MLLLNRLRDNTTKNKMEDKIPKKQIQVSRIFNPIIPRERREKKYLEPSKYINHTCHNTPGDSSSGKYVI